MHSLFFLSDGGSARAEFDCEVESGGAVTVTGRFNPSPPDDWENATYPDAESAADAIEEAVRAVFAPGMMDRDRLTRIVLHKAPDAIDERLLGRFGVPLLMGKTGGRNG